MMSKEEKIYTLALIVLVGFFVAVLFHYIQGVYLGKGYPYNTFLFHPEARFSDFYNVVFSNKDLNPYFRTDRQMQFPFVNLIGYLFSLIPYPINYGLFIIIVTEVVVTSFIVFLKPQNGKTNWIYVIILTFLTYPFLFMLDRGNFDGLVFIFLIAFIYFFSQKRYMISAIFLSFAVAMKVLPAVLLLLFLAEKKYKEVAISAMSTILITMISILFFKGNFLDKLLVAGSIPNLSDTFATGYFSPNNYNYRGVSLFTFCKFLFIETGVIQRIDMLRFLNIYVIASVIIFIPIALYVIFIEKELWKRTALLVIALVILPEITAEYRLLYMFIPIFLFLITKQASNFDRLYTVLFGLLLIPKSYYFFPKTISDSVSHDFNIGVPINVLVLVIMALIIIFTGLSNYVSGLPSLLMIRKENSLIALKQNEGNN